MWSVRPQLRNFPVHSLSEAVWSPKDWVIAGLAFVEIRGIWLAFIITSLSVVLLLVLFLLVTSRRSLENYTDPSGPFYEGHYAEGGPDFDGTLKIVNWNISFSKRTDEAIEVLTEVDELQDADILLLQEMEADSVEEIAQALNYNYIYYPASVHRRHGKDFGEAILSKWPIKQHSKIVLPNSVPVINQTRIAVKAEIMIDGIEMDVYNTHLETVWMFQIGGDTQVDFLADQIDGDGGSVLLGGDFNTWSEGSIATLEDRLGQVGLNRMSAGTGYTFVYRGLKLTMDHIFGRGASTYESGVWHGTSVSDHFPLWTIFYVHE
ncbi:MAG: endonuclease/exonuclease/phosphatase family protein [Anaerolineales bacterium]|nr:endonuclease/exonuclease/phosphatase family protein [Anaerolineales bacterium]